MRIFHKEAGKGFAMSFVAAIIQPVYSNAALKSRQTQ